MPESKCRECGALTTHTDDDEEPECDQCREKRIWHQVIFDIANGDLKVTYDDQGRPIVPGVTYPE